jgi:predicted anti-sigma-YlaC factor YlaD
MRTQVETHLQHCAECNDNYRMQSLAESVMNQEKLIKPAINLTTRIMEQIEDQEKAGTKTISPFIRVLRPVLIVTSMAAAIFAGILIGNINKPSVRVLSIPVELALMDDVAIESVNILSNE